MHDGCANVDEQDNSYMSNLTSPTFILSSCSVIESRAPEFWSQHNASIGSSECWIRKHFEAEMDVLVENVAEV